MASNSSSWVVSSLQQAWSGRMPVHLPALQWNNWMIPLALVLAYALARYLMTPPHTVLMNTSEVRNLPGPDLPWFGWLFGNMVELADHRETLIHPRWMEWGWTGRYESLFRQQRIYTFDPAAVHFIFQNPDDFERPRDLRTILGHIMGEEGMVVNEGEKHRRQRRVLNPAFSAGAIRDMLPIMYDKAGELQVLMERLVDDDDLEAYATRIPAAAEDRVPGARKMDMFKLAGSLTTDVIGLAAFEHDFNSLVPEGDSPSLLANRFTRMVDAANGMAFVAEAQSILPILDWIPTNNRKEIADVRTEMERYSDVFIAKRKTAMAVEADDDSKDLLALLVKAGDPSARSDKCLTDAEVRAQMATLKRLRAEIFAVGEERPSFDTLNALPLLDHVLREILRLHPPATVTARAATRDIVLPISKPIPLKDGRVIDSLPVRKGSYFMIAMARLNRLEEIWGSDAEEFNPDRHADPALPKMTVPGVWGNISSFISGPHACLGYRLALAELKTTLFTILRKFEFSELPSKPEIRYWTSLATQPQVKGQPGGQMPLLVRKLRAQ